MYARGGGGGEGEREAWWGCNGECRPVRATGWCIMLAGAPKCTQYMSTHSCLAALSPPSLPLSCLLLRMQKGISAVEKPLQHLSVDICTGQRVWTSTALTDNESQPSRSENKQVSVILAISPSSLLDCLLLTDRPATHSRI